MNCKNLRFEYIYIKHGNDMIKLRLIKEGSFFPPYIFYNGFTWIFGWNKMFGSGYSQLTQSLSKHPKGNFISQIQALNYLKNDKAEVIENPVKNSKIIDTIKYKDWIK